MPELIDGDYVSHFLIHWAGKGKPASEKADVLSCIAASCRLLLSENFFISAPGLRVREKMVSFTDVPLQLSAHHCSKYSDFGIAFHKRKLMAKSAQPVFYNTHAYIRDMGTIYRFILEQLETPTLDRDVLDALHRHFGFVQDFSDGSADSPDAHYFEREWRIGELTLVPEGEDRGRWCLEKKLPTCVGDLATEGGNSFFKFEQEDVAFLVVPRDFSEQIGNPHAFPVWTFEDLVRTCT